MKNVFVQLRTRDAWRFVEALADLTEGDWTTVAARLRNGQHDSARATSLERLMKKNRASLVGWYLSEGIDTAAWVCRRRGCVSVAVDAARMAALAVLFRTELGEQQFRAFYAPFQDAIPDEPAATSLRNLCALRVPVA